MCDLTKFVDTKMKMTAIYQPLIINSILKGETSLEVIATRCSRLLHGNESKTKDYIKKLKIHPATVLKKHGIAEVVPRSGHFTFMADIEPHDTNRLIALTAHKLSEFMKAKGI